MNGYKILFRNACYVMRIQRLFGERITKKLQKITEITLKGSYRIYYVLF